MLFWMFTRKKFEGIQHFLMSEKTRFQFSSVKTRAPIQRIWLHNGCLHCFINSLNWKPLIVHGIFPIFCTYFPGFISHGGGGEETNET